MDIGKVLKALEDIERIANFQQQRVKDEKAHHRVEILGQALNIIEVNILDIRGELENGKEKI